MNLFLQILVASLLLVVVVQCDGAINVMTACTRIGARIAYTVLASGSAMGALAIALGAVPHWASAIVAAGVVLLLDSLRKCPMVCASLKGRQNTPAPPPASPGG